MKKRFMRMSWTKLSFYLTEFVYRDKIDKKITYILQSVDKLPFSKAFRNNCYKVEAIFQKQGTK